MAANLVREVETRPAGPDDVEAIRWALYAALAWNPVRRLPPFEVVMQHPEAERYHRGWGRAGDLGVIASLGDELVGVAYCRLFTHDDHGHGYVDDETPEVAIAVADGQRGRGVGTRLMCELGDLAQVNGVARLSLSVDSENPARRLYERLGYREVGRDHDGIRMLSELVPERPAPSRA
jgi:GNAT superfamily N-acetyltransferase